MDKANHYEEAITRKKTGTLLVMSAKPHFPSTRTSELKSCKTVKIRLVMALPKHLSVYATHKIPWLMLLIKDLVLSDSE